MGDQLRLRPVGENDLAVIERLTGDPQASGEHNWHGWFGTNHHRGVCVHFREPATGGPGRRAHSALTVTVEDCSGLVGRLGEARR